MQEKNTIHHVTFKNSNEHSLDLPKHWVAVQLSPFYWRVLEVRGVVGKHLRTLEVGYHQQSFKGIEGSVVRQHAQMVAYIGDE